MAAATVESIGVRELRQNASHYLDLVQAGWTVNVTRHGRLVARLVPAHDPADPLAALVAAGLVVPADPRHDLLDVVPAVAHTGESASEALVQMRDEERG